MRVKNYQQYNEELTSSDYRCPICGSGVYQTNNGGRYVVLQCGSDAARFWDFPRGSADQKKSHEHFTKSAISIPRKEFLLESNDSDTMARYQLFGADTLMSFSFGNKDITNVDDIKMLIEVYNKTYNEGKEWGGGPVSKQFIEYFKNYLMDNAKPEEIIFLPRGVWKPVISLMIMTPEYGVLNIGFSLKTKKATSINSKNIMPLELKSGYDESVISEIYNYACTKIYNTELHIDQAINLLRLNVLNEVQWDWVE